MAQGPQVPKTGKAIHDVLDKTYKSAGSFPLAPDTPVVIFSDHHKGARDVPAEPDAHRAKALQLARSQWLGRRVTLRHQKPFPLKTPCYFNTG